MHWKTPMKNGMKKYLNASYRRLFFEWSTYGFAATLPFLVNINTISLWVFIASSVFYLSWKERIQNLKQNRKPITYLGGLFSLFLIGLLFTNNISDGLRDVERTLTLLLIPLFVFSHKREDFNIKRVFIALGIGLAFIMIICWGMVVHSILNDPTPWVQAGYFFEWIYMGWNLLIPIEGHPSYIAILVVLFMASLIFGDSFKSFRKNKWAFIATILPFVLFLLELGSRIGIIALVIIISSYVLKKMNKKRGLYLVLVVAALIILSNKFDFLGEKFDDMFDNRGEVKFERYYRWEGILETFNDEANWLIGTGSGDVQEIYETAYLEGRFYQALSENYNAHNQFIEFLVANGIIGLFVYVFVLLFFAYKTKLKGDAFNFFVLIVLFSASESIFGRSQGVFIFAFFYSIFMVVHQNEKYVKQ